MFYVPLHTTLPHELDPTVAVLRSWLAAGHLGLADVFAALISAAWHLMSKSLASGDPWSLLCLHMRERESFERPVFRFFTRWIRTLSHLSSSLASAAAAFLVSESWAFKPLSPQIMECS